MVESYFRNDGTLVDKRNGRSCNEVGKLVIRISIAKSVKGNGWYTSFLTLLMDFYCEDELEESDE